MINNIFVIFLFLVSINYAYPQGEPLPQWKGTLDSNFKVKTKIEVPGALTNKGTSFKIETGYKNLITNPSFEASTATTGWTVIGSTFSASATLSNVNDGARSLEYLSNGSAASLTQTISSFYSGKKISIRVWVRAVITNANTQICSIVNNTEQECLPITQNTEAYGDYYSLEVLGGATNTGVRFKNDTGSALVYIDDVFVKVIEPTDLPLANEQKLAVSMYIPSNTGCTWTTTSATYVTPGTTASCVAPVIEDSTIGTWSTVDSDLPRISASNLPYGNYTVYATFVGTTSSTNNGCYRLTDGSTNSGEGVCINTTSSNVGGSVTLIGHFPNISGSKDFTIQMLSNGGTTNTVYASSNARVNFKVFYEQANPYFNSICRSDNDCSNVFSARLSSSDVPSQESTNWIDGNCTDASAGKATCNFVSGLFSSTPTCFATAESNTTAGYCRIHLVSSTSVTTSCSNGAGTDTNFGHSIMCIRGDDYKDQNYIQGSIAGYNKTPGTSLMKMHSAKVSSADVVSLEKGDWINGNCTNGTTGLATCTFNAGVFTAEPICQVSSSNTTTARCGVSSSSSSAITVSCNNTTTGTASNEEFLITCQGE